MTDRVIASGLYFVAGFGACVVFTALLEHRPFTALWNVGLVALLIATGVLFDITARRTR